MLSEVNILSDVCYFFSILNLLSECSIMLSVVAGIYTGDIFKLIE